MGTDFYGSVAVWFGFFLLSLAVFLNASIAWPKLRVRPKLRQAVQVIAAVSGFAFLGGAIWAATPSKPSRFLETGTDHRELSTKTAFGDTVQLLRFQAEEATFERFLERASLERASPELEPDWIEGERDLLIRNASQATWWDLRSSEEDVVYVGKDDSRSVLCMRKAGVVYYEETLDRR